MAFKKIMILLTMLLGIPLIASTNIDCGGKSFHCLNSTHFMICVDLGNGVSSTVDDFVIPCPPPTVCQKDNRFECDFPSTTAAPQKIVPLTTTTAATTTATPGTTVISKQTTTSQIVSNSTSDSIQNTELQSITEQWDIQSETIQDVATKTLQITKSPIISTTEEPLVLDNVQSSSSSPADDGFYLFTTSLPWSDNVLTIYPHNETEPKLDGLKSDQTKITTVIIPKTDLQMTTEEPINIGQELTTAATDFVYELSTNSSVEKLNINIQNNTDAMGENSIASTGEMNQEIKGVINVTTTREVFDFTEVFTTENINTINADAQYISSIPNKSGNKKATINVSSNITSEKNNNGTSQTESAVDSDFGVIPVLLSNDSLKNTEKKSIASEKPTVGSSGNGINPFTDLILNTISDTSTTERTIPSSSLSTGSTTIPKNSYEVAITTESIPFVTTETSIIQENITESMTDIVMNNTDTNATPAVDSKMFIETTTTDSSSLVDTISPDYRAEVVTTDLMNNDTDIIQSSNISNSESFNKITKPTIIKPTEDVIITEPNDPSYLESITTEIPYQESIMEFNTELVSANYNETVTNNPLITETVTDVMTTESNIVSHKEGTMDITLTPEFGPAVTYADLTIDTSNKTVNGKQRPQESAVEITNWTRNQDVKTTKLPIESEVNITRHVTDASEIPNTWTPNYGAEVTTTDILIHNDTIPTIQSSNISNSETFNTITKPTITKPTGDIIITEPNDPSYLESITTEIPYQESVMEFNTELVSVSYNETVTKNPLITETVTEVMTTESNIVSHKEGTMDITLTPEFEPVVTYADLTIDTSNKTVNGNTSTPELAVKVTTMGLFDESYKESVTGEPMKSKFTIEYTDGNHNEADSTQIWIPESATGVTFTESTLSSYSESVTAQPPLEEFVVNVTVTALPKSPEVNITTGITAMKDKLQGLSYNDSSANQALVTDSVLKYTTTKPIISEPTMDVTIESNIAGYNNTAAQLTQGLARANATGPLDFIYNATIIENTTFPKPIVPVTSRTTTNVPKGEVITAKPLITELVTEILTTELTRMRNNDTVTVTESIPDTILNVTTDLNNVTDLPSIPKPEVGTMEYFMNSSSNGYVASTSTQNSTLNMTTNEFIDVERNEIESITTLISVPVTDDVTDTIDVTYDKTDTSQTMNTESVVEIITKYLTNMSNNEANTPKILVTEYAVENITATVYNVSHNDSDTVQTLVPETASEVTTLKLADNTVFESEQTAYGGVASIEPRNSSYNEDLTTEENVKATTTGAIDVSYVTAEILMAESMTGTTLSTDELKEVITDKPLISYTESPDSIYNEAVIAETLVPDSTVDVTTQEVDNARHNESDSITSISQSGIGITTTGLINASYEQPIVSNTITQEFEVNVTTTKFIENTYNGSIADKQLISENALQFIPTESTTYNEAAVVITKSVENTTIYEDPATAPLISEAVSSITTTDSTDVNYELNYVTGNEIRTSELLTSQSVLEDIISSLPIDATYNGAVTPKTLITESVTDFIITKTSDTKQNYSATGQTQTSESVVNDMEKNDVKYNEIITDEPLVSTTIESNNITYNKNNDVNTLTSESVVEIIPTMSIDAIYNKAVTAKPAITSELNTTDNSNKDFFSSSLFSVSEREVAATELTDTNYTDAVINNTLKSVPITPTLIHKSYDNSVTVTVGTIIPNSVTNIKNTDLTNTNNIENVTSFSSNSNLVPEIVTESYYVNYIEAAQIQESAVKDTAKDTIDTQHDQSGVINSLNLQYGTIVSTSPSTDAKYKQTVTSNSDIAKEISTDTPSAGYEINTSHSNVNTEYYIEPTTYTTKTFSALQTEDGNFEKSTSESTIDKKTISSIQSVFVVPVLANNNDIKDTQYFKSQNVVPESDFQKASTIYKYVPPSVVKIDDMIIPNQITTSATPITENNLQAQTLPKTKTTKTAITLAASSNRKETIKNYNSEKFLINVAKEETQNNLNAKIPNSKADKIADPVLVSTTNKPVTQAQTSIEKSHVSVPITVTSEHNFRINSLPPQPTDSVITVEDGQVTGIDVLGKEHSVPSILNTLKIEDVKEIGSLSNLGPDSYQSKISLTPTPLSEPATKKETIDKEGQTLSPLPENVNTSPTISSTTIKTDLFSTSAVPNRRSSDNLSINIANNNEKKQINKSKKLNTTAFSHNSGSQSKQNKLAQDKSHTSTTEIPSSKNENTQASPTIEMPFNCQNRIRGKYAHKHDCRKFYICNGFSRPIQGLCPANTVYSEINTLCTRNLSHCIRENEFKCVSAGRFSDALKKNVYYICVMTKQNNFVRFKFKCQTRYNLDKTLVKCVENSDISSKSESQSEVTSSTAKSTTEKIKVSVKKSGSVKKKEKNGFTCEEQGRFPVEDSCRLYYDCRKNKKGEYRRRRKKCDSDEIFHKDKKKCVDAEDDSNGDC